MCSFLGSKKRCNFVGTGNTHHPENILPKLQGKDYSTYFLHEMCGSLCILYAQPPNLESEREGLKDIWEVIKRLQLFGHNFSRSFPPRSGQEVKVCQEVSCHTSSNGKYSNVRVVFSAVFCVSVFFASIKKHATCVSKWWNWAIFAVKKDSFPFKKTWLWAVNFLPLMLLHTIYTAVVVHRLIATPEKK